MRYMFYIFILAGLGGYLYLNPGASALTQLSPGESAFNETGMVGQSNKNGIGNAREITYSDGRKLRWPAKIGSVYPELDLINHNGDSFRISDFKGKVIIIEPTGMNCPACNVFAGGKKYGGFQGNAVAGGMSAEQALKKYGNGVDLADDRIVFITLLLYNMKMQTPTLDDAKNWAEHFRVNKNKNAIVAIPTVISEGMPATTLFQVSN
jgi:hypothetical protein